MSLWEKWEREKLEKMGIKVERKSDVQIRDTRHKHDVLKQTWVVLGALAICLCLSFAAVFIFTDNRWTNTYIVRLIVERNEVRHRNAEREVP